jgi:hypothetical protein
MKFRIYLLIIPFIVISFSAFAQNDSTFLINASRSLSDHFNSNPIEKVYMHLDKPSYNIGDTIWFKAYTVVGNLHQLSALSGVLYCELINGKDSVVSRNVLKLIGGVAWSDFTLPRSLHPGNYHIRAYTNWMRNAGTEYFYNQALHIGGLQPTLPPTSQPENPRPDIQFFPEGGELVNGVRSRVAVKSVGANGLGENIKGSVIDNDGNEVAVFETQHLGMGVFALIPQAGKTYKANIICADSSKFITDLPKAQEEGFTLAINNNNGDSVYVKVAANDKLFQAKQNSSFYLVAQSEGKVYYTAKSKLGAPVFATKILRNRFPTGIVQFTLFSQDGEPLNERVIFVQNNDALKISLSSPAQTYAPRQNVKINMETKDGDSPAVTGSFSVSVINESLIPVNENKESTILNNLLLTSDLKGYIEQPNYYFNKENDQTRSDLDVLMLTQGYRRFDWKQVLNNVKGPTAFQPEKALEIEGSLKTPSGKPLPGGKITLLAPSSNLIMDTVTNLNGDFKFGGLNLPDTARIVLRARKANDGKNVAIYVKQQDFPSVIKANVNDEEEMKLTPEMLKNIAEYQVNLKRDSLKNGIKLNGVNITAKKEHKPDRFNNYGTLLERDLNMARIRDYPSIADAIKDLALGVHISKVFLDGMELYSNNGIVLSTYPINEIQEVRLIDLNSTATKEGILMITTKKYAGTDTTILKGVTIQAKKTSKQPDLSNSANLHGGGNADQVIMGDKVLNCVVLSTCLQGRVFGVNFGRDGTPINTRDGGPMSVIIDGAMLDGSYLNNINPNDIYSIEVLRSGAARSIYGTSIDKGGALVITTRRVGDPNYVTSTTPAGLITYPFKGYSRVRKFYSPKYDGPKTDKQEADLRTTIYWNPLIITDKDGKTSFEYFNADTKGTYRVVVEGIDDNGNIGRQVYRYKVE